METGQKAEGSLAWGIGLGCLFQIGFLIVAVVASVRAPGKMGDLMLASWGVTQWIALGPLIWRERIRGYSKTMNGLIIIGCMGLLVSSGCAMLFLPMGNSH